MILREFGIYADERPPPPASPIHDQTRCILALFERNLPRFVTDDVWKVSVRLAEGAADTKIVNLLGVLQVSIQADYHAFYAAEPARKKRATLDWLEKGLERVCAQFGWPTEPFQRAARSVRESNFSNTWVFDKKWNVGRRYLAYVACEHEPEYFRAELRVESREGNIVARTSIVDDVPSEFGFAQYFGRVKWLNRQQVALLDKQGKEVGTVATAA